jgi:hypothetical protein
MRKNGINAMFYEALVKIALCGSTSSPRTEIASKIVTIQQHHICVVIALLMCKSTLRRPLPSICGAAEQLRVSGI